MMNPLLIVAMIIITGALIFYSIGVFSEFRRKDPTKHDIKWFVLGLICDALGTGLMTYMSNNGDKVLSPGVHTLMSISGTTAIILMAIHLGLLCYVVFSGKFKKNFHILSIVIWAIWLISYAAGPIGLMQR